MKPITGIHSYSFGPRKGIPSSWETLLQVASAIIYKEEFGPIKLYCDQEALDYYRKIDIVKIYDDVELLDNNILKGIDQTKYFATAKILAQLECEEEECIFVDMDLLMVSSLMKSWLYTESCSFLHKETTHVYDKDWEGIAINSAFNYWKDKNLRRKYAAEVLKLMRKGNLSMIDVEQGYLHYFIIENNLFPNYYLENIWDTSTNDFLYSVPKKDIQEIMNTFFHQWGGGKELSENPLKAADFTLSLIELLEKKPEFGFDTILDRISI